jgi:peroxiredoxin
MKCSITSLLLFLLLLFNACERKKQELVFFPFSFQNETEQYMQKHEYIVVVYIDSSGCSPCLFNNLKMWKYFENNLENNNTGVLFIIRSSDEQSVINALKSNKLTFPFIFDKEGIFKARNNEAFNITKDSVFVIDRNQIIIMSESPIASEKQWNAFLKTIAKN